MGEALREGQNRRPHHWRPTRLRVGDDDSPALGIVISDTSALVFFIAVTRREAMPALSHPTMSLTRNRSANDIGSRR